MLARHLVHRPQHRLVADAAPAQRQHELHAADSARRALRHRRTAYRPLCAAFLACFRGQVMLRLRRDTPAYGTRRGAPTQLNCRERTMADPPKTMPRILVVEDEYLIRMLLEDMLADLGYDGRRGRRHASAKRSEFAAKGELRRRHPRRQCRRRADLSRSPTSSPSAACLRLRHRLRRAQPARTPIATARRCRSRSRPSELKNDARRGLLASA